MILADMSVQCHTNASSKCVTVWVHFGSIQTHIFWVQFGYKLGSIWTSSGGIHSGSIRCPFRMFIRGPSRIEFLEHFASLSEVVMHLEIVGTHSAFNQESVFMSGSNPVSSRRISVKTRILSSSTRILT